MRCPRRFDRDHRDCTRCDVEVARHHAETRLLVESCAVCGEKPTYVVAAEYTPTETRWSEDGTLRRYETSRLLGWRTTCHCTVPHEEWTLLFPGPGVTPRWVPTTDLDDAIARLRRVRENLAGEGTCLAEAQVELLDDALGTLGSLGVGGTP